MKHIEKLKEMLAQEFKLHAKERRLNVASEAGPLNPEQELKIKFEYFQLKRDLDRLDSDIKILLNDSPQQTAK